MSMIYKDNLPAISVIIPIYNQEKYLKKCLKSVLKQKLKNIEIICINDGSTDNSLSIINDFASKDSRFIVIDQKNSGVSAARNRGIKTATGEYLFFLDGDDWICKPDSLIKLYSAAKQYNVMACGGNFCEYSEVYGKKKRFSGDFSKYTFERSGLYDYDEFQFDYGWVRFIYNRQFIVENKLFMPDRIYYEDPLWFVKTMSKIKRFYAVNEYIYCYRRSERHFTLSEKQTVCLLKSMTEMLEIASENHYDELSHLIKRRLADEYSVRIIPYVIEKNKDVLEACSGLGKVLGIEQNIEDYLYEISINNYKEQISDLKKSNTWRAGKAILTIPKTILHTIKKTIVIIISCFS